MHIDPFYGLEHWMLREGTLVLNNLSLKPTHPFADTSNRDRNSKSQSVGGRNCEDAKQGTSEEKEKERKTDCRK
jgi:hypothetical protein